MIFKIRKLTTLKMIFFRHKFEQTSQKISIPAIVTFILIINLVSVHKIKITVGA